MLTHHRHAGNWFQPFDAAGDIKPTKSGVSASQPVVRSMRSRRRHKQNLSVTPFRTTLLLRRRPHEPARLAKLYRVAPFSRQPQSTTCEHCSLDQYFALL